MNKRENDNEFSIYVLDLSKKEKEVSRAARREKSKFSFRKIIAGVILAAFLSVANYGADLFRSYNEIKNSYFTANAMSEENIREIGKLLEAASFLPGTKETKKIKELAGSFEEFKSILGFDWPKKYLLVFQNPSEARATGGFIGSVGILSINGGKIKSIKLNDVYNIDGQLIGNIEPPRPIKKISAAWSLHDANWFFDFPASSEKINWLYEKAGGETMDGVIAINPKVVLDLLKAIGPVKVEKYGVELSEKNFIDLTQRQVENEYDKTVNQPKLFLADFLMELEEKFDRLPAYKKISIAKNFIVNLDQKDIQINFKDSGAQAFVENQNWAGKANNSEKDYLAIVHSSINGFKTDAVMAEDAFLSSEIKEDGSIINTLTITRTHNGEESMDDWYKKVNSDYLRVYVPFGSELIEANGMTKDDYFVKDDSIDYNNFVKDELLTRIENSKKVDLKNNVEILEEAGKTVFASWVYVSFGEKITVSFRYKLPFKVDFNASQATGFYSILFQKQSGAGLKKIDHEISFPLEWKIVGNYADWTIKNGKISKAINMESDKFSGIIFGK
ncbi:DUF4012 domain-containing protein [Patescibacteria group bacterium]|nr:DUF4012 domain-containing protein [Patescibacteria group bacterium]MBU4579453.1 DUF4012 domain-containing protein [Patescibacteria group bacterium]